MSLKYFNNKPVSLENLCSFVFDILSKDLSAKISRYDKSRIVTMEIRIWENEQAWAGIMKNLNEM